jgi:predicted nucleotidyltransferase
MDSSFMLLPPEQQAILHRFVSACQADERVILAFLSGSFARGSADPHSDLDFGLLTTDEAFESFTAQKEAFIHRLGIPVFLEDFDHIDSAFFVLENGCEVELAIAQQSKLAQLQCGFSKVLLDKQGLLPAGIFNLAPSVPMEQEEILRRQIYWFWHDLSHFTTAYSRGQLWWAAGQIETLRRICLTLAHLQHNFLAEVDSSDPYFKLDKILPAGDIAVLEASLCPLERKAMLRSARLLLTFYLGLAPDLARQHKVAYPKKLEQLMMKRFKELK